MNAKETIQQVAECLSIAFTQNYSSKMPKSSIDHERWGTFSDFMGGRFAVKN